MKTTGELYAHRGLIAFTGAFLATLTLAGCGNEKQADPQGMYATLPTSQIEIAVQQEKPLTTGEHSVAPVIMPLNPPIPQQAPQQVPRQTPQQMPQQRRDIDKVYQVYPTSLSKTKELVAQLKPAIPLRTRTLTPLSVVEIPKSTVSGSAQCWLGDITDPLREVVTKLEKKSLLYATEPLTDCSGIFHRVVQGLKDQCPAKEFPTVAKNRDSRALALWYHEHGKLQLINNAVDSSDLLRPGAILFFGKNGFKYRDFSVAELLTPQKGIAHLGVVVDVHKNKAGQVEHYELFHGHGRKGKTTASVTNWHKRTPTRTSYPPFGNGQQQWVAVASL
ncbi:MAG: hypothetical protein D3907_07535 [Candidatus Electrothrix sp. AUS3]|nr:hypothetical protein [Candidatus Electrothrix gigas]